MKKYTKGFTLIELLVVIAIIGILSSVVLVSLNSARAKGSDAKVQSTLSGLRSSMEVYYSSNGSYGGADDNASCVAAPFTDATAANGNPKAYVDSLIATVTSTNVSCASDIGTNAGYAVSVLLPSNSTRRFCVDSSGVASTTGSTATIGAGDVSCN